MAKIEIVGTEQALSHTPISSPSTPAHKGEIRMVGESVKLNFQPIPSPSTPPSSAKVNQIGTSVPLDRTPQKGWGSAADLPMSERAVAQSKVSGKKDKKR